MHGDEMCRFLLAELTRILFVGSTGSCGAGSQPPLTAASISRLGATGMEEISAAHFTTPIDTFSSCHDSNVQWF